MGFMRGSGLCFSALHGVYMGFIWGLYGVYRVDLGFIGFVWGLQS